MLANKACLAVIAAAAVASSGCAHATRNASPQPSAAAVALTSAPVTPRARRVLVAERGAIGMVTRGGCVASIAVAREGEDPTDVMRVRCPRPERLATWFAAVDPMLANIPVVEVDGDDDDDDTLPAAELVTPAGAVLRLTRRADAERVIGEVRALSAELGAAEEPRPGPPSSGGWQMLRVAGSAHVLLGGAPRRGLLDARVSTSGQYFCEFSTLTDGGVLRASKSGWIEPDHASGAIDVVLEPFRGAGADERARPTYAAAITAGSERRANVASTAAVFERFSSLQSVLGDACIPELDAPAPLGL